MQKIDVKEVKVSLTLQVSQAFAEELNAAVTAVTPRASRSSVIETAIREWLERNTPPPPVRRGKAAK